MRSNTTLCQVGAGGEQYRYFDDCQEVQKQNLGKTKYLVRRQGDSDGPEAFGRVDLNTRRVIIPSTTTTYLR